MLNILKVHADWISFILLAALFVVYPQIDLAVSGWFYDPVSGDWWGSDSAVADSIYGIFRYIPYFLVPVLQYVVYMNSNGRNDQNICVVNVSETHMRRNFDAIHTAHWITVFRSNSDAEVTFVGFTLNNIPQNATGYQKVRYTCDCR